MKKVLLSLIVCVYATVAVSLNGVEQNVIPLTEMEIGVPLDDADGSDPLKPTDPTRFQATISGNVLHVVANTGMIARMQVENNTTGEVVEEKSFTATTVVSISAAGSYTLYIQSGNTMVAGEFEVE